MQYPNFMPLFYCQQQTSYPQYFPMYYMPVMPNYMMPSAQPLYTQEPEKEINFKSMDSTIDIQSQQVPNAEKQCLIKSSHTVEANTEISEEISTNTLANKPKQKQGKKKINLLQKSTNIQKNYAKAIVSYSCGQRVMIINSLGKKKGVEFLKLITQLKNKLKNISHIKNYTDKESFLRMFRILGNNFMKYEAVSYVYHSNIQQKSCHLKYMKLIQQNLLKC